MAPAQVRSGVAAMTRVLRQHVSAPDKGPTRIALDVARNVATVLWLDHVADRRTPGVRTHIAQSLRARAALGWISIADVDTAATDAGIAWERAVSEGRFSRG